MLFSQPAFLWALLAVLVPVAVHLFSFRRYRKVHFSNVQRLSELHTEQRRHRNLRQWLVLAARILAVVFVVLAFAQPVVPNRQAQLRSGTSAVSIYVDNSFSMANATAEGSMIDAARRKVHEVADAYGVGDKFQLITNDMRGSEMRWLNRDELLEAADALEPSPAAPLMSTVATRLHDFLAQSGTHNRHAYIISDFQQSTADLDALPADSTMQVTLVPLSATVADNIYIDSLWLDAPAYHIGGTVDISVALRNSGSHDIEKVPVKLYIGGRERALTSTDLPADGSATATLRFTIDSAGWVDGRVAIEDYPISFDDNYHFAFRVDDLTRVLELDGQGANPYLERLFANDESIVLQRAPQLQHDLAQYDLVVLNEPRTLSSGEVQQLSQWVAEGGSLVAIPSEQSGTALNSLLASLQAPQLKQWVRRQVKANTIDYSHSLYRSVFNSRTDEMEMPSVQGHYSLEPAVAVHQTIVGLADGGELLCVTPTGAGRLYLFTTPLDESHTDLVNQALFVPTLYNMALYSRTLPPVAHTLGDYSPIALQGDYAADRQPPTLSDGADISLLPDLRRTMGTWHLLPHGELPHDGIYTLADEHLAFNYPRRESRMEFLDHKTIAEAASQLVGYTLVRNSTKPLTDELRDRDGGRPLWRLCLLLALAALALETILLKLRP